MRTGFFLQKVILPGKQKSIVAITKSKTDNAFSKNKNILATNPKIARWFALEPRREENYSIKVTDQEEER